MKQYGWWIALVLASVVLLRSRIGLAIGNQARALSDKLVVATLQLTSEFESEL